MEAGVFGGALRRARIEAGLTQEGLAGRAMISVRAVSDLERGVNRTARRHTAWLLADGLGLVGAVREAFLHLAAGDQPTAVAAAQPSGAPLALGPLLGRQAELVATQRMLTDGEGRLITLVGPGGVGKTRLAVEVSARLAGDFADGVAFVGLAERHDAETAAGAIAARLGVSPGADPPLVALARHLGDRHLLIVLDNLEQLPDVGEVVAELLAAAPELRVLATSRVPLRLTGERRLVLGPLPRSAAVELYVWIASKVAQTWAPSAPDLDVIGQICSRLGCLPLAVELAAARCRLLAPHALLERLGTSLDILAGDRPAQPRRQQTMRASIAWSYDLLPPAEQTLFDRLAVFRGGWTVAAADAVCGLDSWTGLEALVDGSLVIVAAGAAEPRLAMLEPIRQFALERLTAHGEREQVDDEHGRWAAALAGVAERELVGPSQTSCLARLDDEHDNLRAALAYAVSMRAGGRASRLAAGLWRYWYLRGLLVEGRMWTARVLDTCTDGWSTEDRAANARVEYGAGILAWLSGDLDAATAHAELARHRLTAAGEAAVAAYAANLLGMIRQYRGEHEAAGGYFDTALSESRRIDDTRGVATALVNLGTLATEDALHQLAVRHLEESLALFRALGDGRSAADVLCSLGDVARRQQRLGDAEALFRQGLDQFERLGDVAGQTEAHQHLARLARERNDPRASVHHHEVVLELSRAAGDPWGTASALTGLAELGADTGRPDAAALFREALTLHRRLEHRAGMVECLERLSSLSRARGDLEEAAACDDEVATLDAIS